VAGRIVGGREREHLAVGLLGAVERARLERGVRDDGPRDAPLRGGRGRLQGEHLFGDGRGARVVVPRGERGGRVGQRRRRAGGVGEASGKAAAKRSWLATVACCSGGSAVGATPFSCAVCESSAA